MITPRQTRLYRAADLRSFQRIIRHCARQTDLWRAQSCAVLVPSAAAAEELRRTLENHHLQTGSSADRTIALPLIFTRAGWYDAMHARLPQPPRRLSELEREVLIGAAARNVANEIEPPFRLRAGLLLEMLGLYDDLRRRGSSVDTFERLITRELERDAENDRGAQRLLTQTTFLAAAFRAYEAGRDATGAVDEYALRAKLLETPSVRPLRHIIVTVGERSVDPAGLWPADLDLLTRLPLVEEIDIVATRATIAAGLLDRLEKFMPGFEEAELRPDVDDPVDHANRPVLVAASDGKPFSVSRDREDELSSIARSVKAAGGADLERRAVVFKRPLPYVYLARDVFDDAGVPYQTFDALPLAAEPYAAALDLVFEFVTSNFTREPVIALLSSPHFSFDTGGAPLRRSDIAAFNRALSDEGYFGGADRLRAIAAGGTWKAAKAAAAAADELEPLAGCERPSVHLSGLLAFLGAHDRIPPEGDPLRERHLRARRAVLAALHGLRRAHQHLDDTPVELTRVAAMIRRWIEGQTFAPRAGTGGVHLLDAQAARYGEFDEVFLVGLVEGEWPERAAKSIFYPGWLLNQLDWPDSRVALAGERAAFQDLVGLARRKVHLSTFELEHDAIIGPSVFLEDLDRIGLRKVERDVPAVQRIFVHEGLTSEPLARAVDGEAAAWLDLRAGRTDAVSAQFHGAAAPYRPVAYSISSLERYLQCPFRFFSERVLKLEEDPEDETTLNPKELGLFVHEVFQRFFDAWNRQGYRGITPDNLTEARAIFRDVAEPLLATLPEGEAAVQRTRLLGSAADEGLAEAVFQAEAEWETPVVERLLEYALEGEFEIQGEAGPRRIPLRGKADRIDLLSDGTFRLIDYKLSRAPDRKQALQLPIYTICTVQHLRQTRGEDWQPGQAGYIAFGQERQFVPMLARGKDRDQALVNALAAAQARLLDAVDRIERGEFPPTPADPMMCTRCAHALVCRKDYVGDV